jgi:L-lactate dehydrogenase complex protein LldF
VYRAVGGHAYDSVYSGPVGAIVTPGLTEYAVGRDLPHASTLCGACRDVCPVRIDIPRLLLTARAAPAVRADAPAWLAASLRAFAAVATRPRLFRFAQRWAGRLAGGRDAWFVRLPGPLGAWTRARDFPRPAPESFMASWNRERNRS